MLRSWQVFAFIIAGLFSASSAQSAPLYRNSDRPWGKGILMPSLALGGSFGGGNDINHVLIGAGVSYYVLSGFAVGLTLTDQIFFLSADFKARYPGIQNAIPTNHFTMMPTLQYVFWRNPWFSPYAFAGTGPVFLNHKNGVIAQWTAGPGFYIGTGSPVFIDLGVSFSGSYPTDKCRDAFSHTVGNTLITTSNCSWGWGIRGGLVLAFGVGGRKQRSTPPFPERVPSSPPSSLPNEQPPLPPLPETSQPVQLPEQSSPVVPEPEELPPS